MSDSPPLLRTPLAAWHAAHGGRMVEFAGWSMPVQYGSIVQEHVATRTGVGLFDVSHMGRLTVRGDRGGAWLDSLLTRRVSDAPAGRVRYAVVCNESGGALDDVLVTRVTDDRLDLVVNASNREKLLDWFSAHPGQGLTLLDRTEVTAMIAVQGPGAVALVQSLAESDVAAIRYYRSGESNVAGVPCVVSRTGYTGEDGFELICAAEPAEGLWQTLVDRGAVPCGLAARDTLRLEAGMPLYGHELTDQVGPVQAGLGFAIDTAGADGSPRRFIGSDAIAQGLASPTVPVRVGLRVEGKRPPREGYAVLAGGQPAGVVTSGTHSPTLGTPIAMALVDPAHATEGTRLTVDVRGAEAPAVVVALPFYRRG